MVSCTPIVAWERRTRKVQSLQFFPASAWVERFLELRSLFIDGVLRVFSRLTAPNGLEPPKGCFAIPGISCPPRLTQQIRREA